MSQQLIKVDPGKLAMFGNQAANAKFSAGIKTGEFLPKISLKGREFALVIGGERKRSKERTLNVVIVDARASVSKSFYKNPYDSDGEKTAPDCQSTDGVVPDAGVPMKQSDTCQLCPYNAWKSGTNGKGKRCADTKTLVVVPANNLDGQPFQLQIPPASLKSFGAYVKLLDANGIPVNGVVTQLSFADSDFPQLEFAFVDALPSEEAYKQVLAISERADVQEVIKGAPIKAPESHPAQQPVTIQRSTPDEMRANQVIAQGKVHVPEVVDHTTDPPELDAGTRTEIDNILDSWGVSAK